ncbi:MULTISPECIES: SGNH/GDSL hydrolase family protein [unclassified Chryseobacterium]|uniref:SGNH/GDSL hydrolase family protein n=1 Tax=unclassified Chryseobacterium TaxID=2593645 RepID=UPI00285357BC|nr:SGNH/GDSL hydrolase family protein [Chryseobacterium sp. CFS7]MDR4894329.1 SGNH/GDSL hydrolase family protein [Chryseobacterium sp. CFS7]
MIDRIVILGDSMSDFGIKKDTIMGMVARAAGLMRVNAVGRFSDSKNWADYISEWSGMESLIDDRSKKETNALTKKKISLKESTHGSPDNRLSFVNYAVGGAVVNEREKLKHKLALTTILEQKEKYFKELDSDTFKAKNTMHIVWIGLNDTVTDGKDASKMKAIVDQVKGMTDEIRARVARDGGKAYFMVVNNPAPEEAVRYTHADKDPEKRAEVEKAQAATLEFNKQLKEAFPDKYDDTMVVDMYEALKTNLYNLRLIKAAQHRGRKVQFNKPEDKDTSLANTLKEFKEIYKDKGGNEIFDEIQPLLDKANKTDNEITLHREVGDLIIKKMAEGHQSAEKLESIKAVKNALMATGTYPSQIEFVTKYYQQIRPEKHQADIAKLQGELNTIFSQNLVKQLDDNLNIANTGLYDTVGAILNDGLNKDGENKDNSTFRKLLDNVTANNLGFVATSDGAHPTQAAYKAIALTMASHLIQGFSVLPGPDFIQNAQNALVEAEIFENKVNIPLTRFNDKSDLSKFTKPAVKENPEAVLASETLKQQQPKDRIQQDRPKTVTFKN